MWTHSSFSELRCISSRSWSFYNYFCICFVLLLAVKANEYFGCRQGNHIIHACLPVAFERILIAIKSRYFDLIFVAMQSGNPYKARVAFCQNGACESFSCWGIAWKPCFLAMPYAQLFEWMFIKMFSEASEKGSGNRMAFGLESFVKNYNCFQVQEIC